MNRTPFEEDHAAALPCAGGLLAGTLALMTRCAEPECAATPPHQALLARKIVSNLYFLRGHPDLPLGLRLVITKLHARWSEIAGTLPATPAPAPADAVGLH